MGEYWKPVNVTRKEWIHPHCEDEGLKWGEWSNPDSAVVSLMRSAWASTDEVFAVSDYGGLKRLDMSTVEDDDGWPTIAGKDVRVLTKIPKYQDLEEGKWKRIGSPEGSGW